MEIMTRKQARERGLSKYHTGKACKHGHLSKRYTSTGVCVECKSKDRKKHYQNNKDRILEISKEWYINNRERKLKTSRKWKSENKERSALTNKIWREENIERDLNRSRKYYKDNKDKVIKRTVGYAKKRKLEDPDYAMYDIYRSMVKRVLDLTGQTKETNTESLCGYSKDDLVAHLKSNFIDGMTMDNRGHVWHIDHIVPVSHLISCGVDDPSTINALSNLRPMFVEDNLSKGSRQWEEWAEKFPERSKLYKNLVLIE